MDRFNETELQIALEKRAALQRNKETYDERRLRFEKLLIEAEQKFKNGQNQLNDKLRASLSNRAELRRNGFNNFAIEMQNSFAEENAIQKAQRENRELWAQARAKHKEAMRNITEQYQTQAIKIKADANEKLQAVIAERRKQSNNIAGASVEPQEWHLIPQGKCV